MKFYRCKHCGQIVHIVDETGVPIICCGEAMEEIIPGTTDGAKEKHVPVYEVKDGKVYVSVGAQPHPMDKNHFIEWVAIKTRAGCQLKKLEPGREPIVCFALCTGDELKEVYAYCNLHMLWKG